MDNSNGSGNNLVLWLPGSALILSLVVSTFALTREPFLEPRPIGAQFQAQSPIEAPVARPVRCARALSQKVQGS